MCVYLSVIVMIVINFIILYLNVQVHYDCYSYMYMLCRSLFNVVLSVFILPSLFI